MFGGFAFDAAVPLRVVSGNMPSAWFSFFWRTSHRELARRDQAELHADAVRILDRHTEVLGPGFLMSFGLRSVEGGDGGRRLFRFQVADDGDAEAGGRRFDLKWRILTISREAERTSHAYEWPPPPRTP